MENTNSEIREQVNEQLVQKERAVIENKNVFRFWVPFIQTKKKAESSDIKSNIKK